VTVKQELAAEVPSSPQHLAKPVQVPPNNAPPPIPTGHTKAGHTLPAACVHAWCADATVFASIRDELQALVRACQQIIVSEWGRAVEHGPARPPMPLQLRCRCCTWHVGCAAAGVRCLPARQGRAGGGDLTPSLACMAYARAYRTYGYPCGRLCSPCCPCCAHPAPAPLRRRRGPQPCCSDSCPVLKVAYAGVPCCSTRAATA